MGIQQMMLGAGGKTDPVYIDNVFSTYLHNATGSTLNINNGIDLSGDGGLVWLKRRNSAAAHQLYDTVRGVTKQIYTNNTGAENAIGSTLTTFNNNGYTIGDNAGLNASGDEYVGWTFKRTKGFFDVVSYTGNGTAGRTVNHSLGSTPGFIMIKRLDGTDGWIVSHRNSWSKISQLTNAAFFTGGQFHYTTPTSTQFTLGDGDAENGDGHSYIAYVFGGGESTAATARSVEFDGTNDYMTIPTHADLAMGTGDLTMEGWVLTDGSGIVKYIYDGRDGTSANRIGIWIDDTNKLRVYVNNVSKDSTTVLNRGQWYHFAWTRQGTTSRLFINGLQELSWSDSVDYAAPANNSYIGGTSSAYNIDGKISNFRIVKGTAVYTSSFRPLTKPLTNITNTKLLCCNNSSVAGSTVSPTTITSTGPTASTDSPFDDPAGLIFGENKDEGIIKCGSYVGNTSNYPDINLGWEPQYVWIKRKDGTGNWRLFDSMRGTVTGENDAHLQPNWDSLESNFSDNTIDLTSTGFRIASSDSNSNTNLSEYNYLAIRRNDPYVSTPVTTATSVFGMGDGGSSVYTAGFPVDFAMYKNVQDGGNDWWSVLRLLHGKEFKGPNTTAALSTWAGATFDSMTTWGTSVQNSNHVSWMWKRHAGFDVVNFDGQNIVGWQVPHNLGRTPEMIWVKCRNDTYEWNVWHKGLNGGTNPEQYYAFLTTNAAQGSASNRWNNTAPTSTHVTFGDSAHTNGGGTRTYSMMLFASVDGISKCGSYNGSSSTITVTTGFQPRYVIIKRTDAAGDWYTLDTHRTWGSGGDYYLSMNASSEQGAHDFGAPTSTGFTLTVNSAYNASGGKYIYYAHA